MNRELWQPGVLGVAVAAAVALSGIEIARQPSVFAAAAPPSARETLRVGMWTLWHDREVRLTPAASPRKTELRTCAQCAPLNLTQPAQIRAEGDALAVTMAGKTLHADRVWIDGTTTLAAHGETVTLDNPVTIAARGAALTIAVTLPVESYVERVVASESGPADSVESLKALAIVVRSFALHEEHGHADFDVCDSTHCQLLRWNGAGREQAAAHAATLKTAGETLWFHGQRALAYFSKDCGGHTASPEEIWPKARPEAYLPSRADHYCTADGGSEWSAELTRADLTAILAARGLARPGWQSVSVARRGESGRAVTLKIDAMEVDAEEFRLAVGQGLGWNRIPSTLFEVSRDGDRFLFHGRGWGHGVGLCQKGAAAMAAQNFAASQILAQYFPGAEAADEASGLTWRSDAGSGFVLETLDAADSVYLPELDRTRALATERSGLNSADPITVRAFDSTPAFRGATLEPGWVAAFTEGQWIGTQPLRTLAARHLLDETMLHEFLHALVEREAGARAPLWLREGLVEAWSSGNSGLRRAPAIRLEALDAALAQSSNEEESEAAHRAAGWYSARLLNQYGRAQTLEWLRSGVPGGVVSSLGL
ncbi:MAG: SpoIID/LytB domain-containing protein [Terracidiphilus sp.]